MGCLNLDTGQSGADSFIVALRPLLSVPAEVALEASNPQLFSLERWGCTRLLLLPLLSLGELVGTFLDKYSSQQGALQGAVVFWP